VYQNSNSDPCQITSSGNTRKEGSTASYPLTDALGSVIGLTDASGVVQTQYSYEPYGKATRSRATTNNSQTYTGREDDGTGLYYYRARYFSPALHRLTSEDPLGIASGQSNLYQYAVANPIDNRDPLGLFNVIGGVGGSFVPGYGFEGSLGAFWNPGSGGYCPGAGFFGSAGQGVGLNMSYTRFFLGFVVGGMNNLEGDTDNFNYTGGWAGKFGVTVMYDRKDGHFLGLSIGAGPDMNPLPFGLSISDSTTRTWPHFPPRCGCEL
jgi:RHS repeat-associated protein